MQDAKATSTPMEADYLKHQTEENLLPNNIEYHKAVGGLLYIATTTRPDISAAVGLLCRRTNHPRQCDWNAVKRVHRYLKGTAELRLHICVGRETQLNGYVDADWGSDPEDRKSISGYIFMHGGNTISWGSKKQTSVALSSTEAEYIAASLACQELSWLHQLFVDLGYKVDYPTILREDNQGCIKLATSEKSSARTKHIDVRHHYLRNLQEQNVMRLVYCTSQDMVADALTKPLPRSRFTALTEKMGLINRAPSSGGVRDSTMHR